MVQPREEFLGNITELDKFGEGIITCNSSVMRDVNGILHTARSGAPSGSAAGNGIFWVEDTTPSLPKFTDSAGTTITLGISSVTSVFTRTGAVTAQAGDYNTSQITNSSSLTGVTLTAVLEALGSSDIANESTLTGATVTDALNGIGSDDVANESSVAGTTVSNALDNLFAAIPSTPTLAQVLTTGNDTGSNWIDVNDGFGLRGQASGSSFTIQTLDTSGTSGNLTVETGSGDTGSGDLTLQTGSSGDVSGNILIQTTGSTNESGNISLLTKASGTKTGAITIQTGNSATNGSILISAGGAPDNEFVTGDGYIDIYAANANGLDSPAGSGINIKAGNGVSEGGGVINIAAGDCGDGDNGTVGGDVNIYAGNSGGTSIRAGDINLTTRTGGFGRGGDINMFLPNVAGNRAGRMLLSLGAGTGNDVSFFTINSNQGTVGEKFRFGAYGTLSFFEHADPDGNNIGWLPTAQAGETALFRRHEALVYWDSTNNLYTELTDREMPTA
jgi:hypothetical protein